MSALVEELDISDYRNADLSSSTSTSAVSITTSSSYPITHAPNTLLNLSPSSPDVSRVQARVVSTKKSTARAQTLPRKSTHVARAARRNNSQIDELMQDQGARSRLRRWIKAIVIVEFDLDEGPVVNGVCPPLDLPDAAWESIAFSSFPDCLQSDQGSQAHSFRIRCDPQVSPDGYLLGFSHFTRSRDTASKRGYTQRSLVILSHRQFPALFTVVASKIGQVYELHGLPALEASCQNIANWPDLCPGAALMLGVAGAVLRVELPHSDDEQQFAETSSFGARFDPRSHILASFTPFTPAPIELFGATLSHLWSIWECLILCNEGLLLFGTSPAATSQAAWWFRDLLRPIPLAHDIRPYFTLQDQDHSRLVNKMPASPGLILGVTNPFFERLCQHWPHVLSLGCQRRPKSTTDSHVIAGPPPGWKTTHKRYISKDRSLLKRVEDLSRGTQNDKLEASLAVLRHFHSRTASFLVPLNRYLQTLIPPPSELRLLSPEERRLKPFNNADFFASLKKPGAASPLPFKSSGKRTEFYERWFRSPAFGVWLGEQDRVVREVLERGRG